MEQAFGAGAAPVLVYPGLGLFYFSPMETADFPAPRERGPCILITYCRDGPKDWETSAGNRICLPAGDFWVQGAARETGLEPALPGERCTGLCCWAELDRLGTLPPEVLPGAGAIAAALEKKYCRGGAPAVFTGSLRTEQIFSPLFTQSPALLPAYQKIKVLELLLCLLELAPAPKQPPRACRTAQMETVRQIHDQLMENLDQRVTIESLARQYLMNPTTLKQVFKSVYGSSLAAHMKEHRMRQAAKLLTESDLSIAQIAAAVGYDSQSRFTAAFKAHFSMLPKEYRKG